VLQLGGLLAFTAQSHAGEGVIVGEDRRFAHAELWLREKLHEARLRPVRIEEASTRQDRGQPVPGLLVVAERS
jgi:predicted TPR repeat methyltransferase